MFIEYEDDRNRKREKGQCPSELKAQLPLLVFVQSVFHHQTMFIH